MNKFLLRLFLFMLIGTMNTTPFHLHASSTTEQQLVCTDLKTPENTDFDDDYYNYEEPKTAYGKFKEWISDTTFKAKILGRLTRRKFVDWYNQERGKELLLATLAGAGLFASGYKLGSLKSNGAKTNKATNSKSKK